MGKYDNVKYLEYIEKRNKMMNDFGRTGGRCDGANCSSCPICDKSHMKCMDVYNPEEALRIVMEYKPPIDWSKVAVDTKIWVRNANGSIYDRGKWHKRYFAEYKNGKVYAWANGTTSYSAEECTTEWDEAKLYEGDIINDKTDNPKYKVPRCFGNFSYTEEDWDGECDYCNHLKDCKKATEEKPNGK